MTFERAALTGTFQDYLHEIDHHELRIKRLEAAIDEAKTLAKITKPILHSDVVDYSFLRAAVKK
jgi:hypothetical protein